MLKDNLSKEVKLVIEYIANMPDQDKTILIERFKKNKSMQAVAKIFDCSGERIKQLEDKVIAGIEMDYKNLT